MEGKDAETGRFLPGNPGKPKGAKDRKWASLEYWGALIQERMESGQLTDEGLKAALKMFEMILARRPLPPNTPEQSVASANAKFKQMSEVSLDKLEAILKGEKGANGSGGSGSGGSGNV